MFPRTDRLDLAGRVRLRDECVYGVEYSADHWLHRSELFARGSVPSSSRGRGAYAPQRSKNWFWRRGHREGPEASGPLHCIVQAKIFPGPEDTPALPRLRFVQGVGDVAGPHIFFSARRVSVMNEWTERIGSVLCLFVTGQFLAPVAGPGVPIWLSPVQRVIFDDLPIFSNNPNNPNNP